jgi:hypothetical protein
LGHDRRPGQPFHTRREGSAVVEFDHINDDEAGRLMDLAALAKSVLQRAGIPASLADGGTDTPGALIEVDTGADDAGGVFIAWSLSSEMTAEVSDHLLKGEFAHAAVQEAGRIRAAMCEALISILAASGISATLNEDDMRPLTVAVQ